MKASKYSRKRLGDLSLERVSTYLIRSKWRKLVHEQPNAIVFEYKREDDEIQEVAIPRDPNFIDYSIRMDQALQEIALVEKRTPLEVLDDVSKTRNRREHSNGKKAH